MKDLKLQIALQIEKLHRYVFNNIYIQTVKNKHWHQIPIRLLNIAFLLFPKWRKVLYNYDKTKYQRYK